MARSEKTFFESEYVVQLLAAMKEQTLLCNEILKKAETIISFSNAHSKSNNGSFNFTPKEIKSMPRLKDFTIRTINDKYFQIRYRKHSYNVSFSSKDFNEAKQKAFAWLNTFENQIKADYSFTVVSKAEKTHNIVNKKVSFKTFADTFLENVKKRQVKENTFKDLIRTYNNHIVKRYGKMQIKDITPLLIQTHLNTLSEKTPRLCETVKSLLNNIFEYAVNNGVIELNPVKAVYLQKHQRKTGSALTVTEEKVFLKSIKNHKYEIVYLKMLYSGVRPCEINTVVEDLNANTLTIKNGKLKNYQTNFYRTIPIFPMYKPYANIKCKKINTIKLSQAFKEICPNHSLKDLRHTFTTRARECGIDNELVAVWTGHTLGNITSSVYTHFSNEFQQEQAKKLVY